MRVLKNVLKIVLVTFLAVHFGSLSARAESALIDVVKEKSKWAGKASWTEGSTYNEEDIEIIFHAEGSPPNVAMITHKWAMDSARKATQFKFDGTNVKFWIDPLEHPKSRKRIYDLTLDKGTLKGTLSGVNRAGTGTFSIDVLLKPK